jgi:hypothetical protein
VIPRRFRIRILKRFAQGTSAGVPTSPASPDSPDSPTSPASPQAPSAAAKPIQNINLRAIPLFKTNLFANFPSVIDQLNLLVNKINRYMLTLGQKNVGFDEVYTNPSVSGSNFDNSLKKLLNLSKWIYSLVIVDRPPYSYNDLHKIFNDMISSLNQYSFPEPTMANTQNDLILTVKTIRDKLLRA